MTIEEVYIQRLKDAINHYDDDDIEALHVVADKILCEALKELGFNNLVKLFDSITKWYA